ncbi:MAG: hypothetical protein Q7S61_02985 [bacterium]|nr:hypothetical protein [bacterium]
MPPLNYLETLQRRLKKDHISRSQFIHGASDVIKYVGIGALGTYIGNTVGHKRGYEEALSSVVASYPPQYIDTSQEEAVHKFLLDGSIDYVPPTEKERPVVSLPENIFPTKPLQSLAEFFKAAPNYLQSLIEIIEANKNNPNFNPDFSHLYTFQKLSRYKKWSPQTLLTTLSILHEDINGGYIALKEGDEKDNVRDNMINRSAATFTPLQIDDEYKPRILPSIMSFYPNMLSQKYPSVENGDENVPISQIGLLPIIVYESMNRYNVIANLEILDRQLELFQDRHFTTDEFYDLEDDLIRVMHKYGRRYSAENNTVQLGMIRSLAAIAGNPNGKVKGLERSEDWSPRIYQVAALQGDVKALTYLQRNLYQNAGY